MGACCNNDERDKKEARLDELSKNILVEEHIAKAPMTSLSPQEEDAIFEEEAKKMRSPNEEVNVLFKLPKVMYKEKGPYEFGGNVNQSKSNLALKESMKLDNGDVYYGFW